LLKPGLFVVFVFVSGAAIVLCVDAFFVGKLPNRGVQRLGIVALIGALFATVPWLIVNAFTGQGMGALAPQLEYLPFAIAGAIFAVILDRLTVSPSVPQAKAHDA
jgi:hypothetical protein